MYVLVLVVHGEEEGVNALFKGGVGDFVDVVLSL
jgi:hypothetical protein